MIQPENNKLKKIGSNLTTGARLHFGYDFSKVGFTTAASVLVETGSGDAGSEFVLDSVVVLSEVGLGLDDSVLVGEGNAISEEGMTISGISGSQ